MSEYRSDMLYNNLKRLLKGTAFEAEFASAAGLIHSDLRRRLKERQFEFTDLMWLLIGAIVPTWSNLHGENLERDLGVVITTSGFDIAKNNFVHKLLVRNKEALQDACYEVSVVARLCNVLDKGTIELEKPIRNPAVPEKDWKNSDIFGLFNGKPVRVEVTVLHEQMPTLDLDLAELIERASSKFGFEVTLSAGIRDTTEAEWLRSIVEELSKHHQVAGTTSVEYDGNRFTKNAAEYTLESGKCRIKSVRFFPEGDLRGGSCTRQVRLPANIRIVSPHYLKSEFKNPSGTADVTDLPDFERQVPVSKKVRDAIQKKLLQCELGVTNIVAFGNPSAANNNDVRYALYGAPYVNAKTEMDADGNRTVLDASLQYASKAPFNPAGGLTAEDVIEFIDPFRLLSGILEVRIGSAPKTVLHINPNATVGIDPSLQSRLVSAGPKL